MSDDKRFEGVDDLITSARHVGMMALKIPVSPVVGRMLGAKGEGDTMIGMILAGACLLGKLRAQAHVEQIEGDEERLAGKALEIVENLCAQIAHASEEHQSVTNRAGYEPTEHDVALLASYMIGSHAQA